MTHFITKITTAGHQLMILFLLAVCITSVQAQIELKFNLNNRGDLVTEDHYGIFYEEINHAGDGGLYAELIRNRSFEEDMDKPMSWSTVGNAEMHSVWSCLGRFGAEMETPHQPIQWGQC